MPTISLYTHDFDFEACAINLGLYGDPISGRYVPDYGNFIEAAAPRNIPEYMMSTVMQFYSTPENVLIPMFILLEQLYTSEGDTFHTITQRDQYRPDLISYHYYETVNYWWIILLANNILDPMHMEIGSLIRIPNRSVILTRWLQPPLTRVEVAS